MTKRYVDGVYKDETREEERKEMVHCDYGWKSAWNGYYITGVFNSSSTEREIDDKRGKNPINYNNYIHIVKY